MSIFTLFATLPDRRSDPVLFLLDVETSDPDVALTAARRYLEHSDECDIEIVGQGLALESLDFCDPSKSGPDIQLGSLAVMRWSLQPGDEVTWNDPDDGACTRTLTIRSIEYRPDMVQITDTDGGYLECFLEELS